MRVHILDDWFDTLRGLPSFDKLRQHEVTVWTDHVQDIDLLSERLNDAEAVVLFRERTAVTRAFRASAAAQTHLTAQRLSPYRCVRLL